MESQYSDSAKYRALQTLISIEETLQQLMDWNKNVQSADYFACSQSGMQLLAADAMLIPAIGEGINKVNSKLPDFLKTEFPEITWQEIVGMRNHIVHGYFDLDADIVFDAIKSGIPPLHEAIIKAVDLCKKL